MDIGNMYTKSFRLYACMIFGLLVIPSSDTEIIQPFRNNDAGRLGLAPSSLSSDLDNKPGEKDKISLRSIEDGEELLRAWDQVFINALANTSSGHHHQLPPHPHDSKEEVQSSSNPHFLLSSKSRPGPQIPVFSGHQQTHEQTHQFSFNRAKKPFKGRYYVVVSSLQHKVGDSIRSNGTIVLHKQKLDGAEIHHDLDQQRLIQKRTRRHHHHRRHGYYNRNGNQQTIP